MRSQNTYKIKLNESSGPLIEVPQGYSLVGIHVPANFSPTSLALKAATSLSATAQAVKNAGNTAIAVTITTLTAAYYALDPTLTRGISYLQLTANGNQATSDTELTLVFERL